MPYPRSRVAPILVLGLLAAIMVAGITGYLVGTSQVGHATLRVQVTSGLNENATVQITVNGALVGTLAVPHGQTASLDVAVAYATSNGAAFAVEASTTQGPRDSTTVFVNTPGIFVVDLQLG